MSESNPNLFCPLTNNLCVGENQCAPAVIYARMAQSEEATVAPAPVCPIVCAMESARALSLASMTMIGAGMKEQEELSEREEIKQIEELPEDQRDAALEELRERQRRRVISGAQIDQV